MALLNVPLFADVAESVIAQREPAQGIARYVIDKDEPQRQAAAGVQPQVAPVGIVGDTAGRIDVNESAALGMKLANEFAHDRDQFIAVQLDITRSKRCP
jgi:hypothetical protein